MHSVDERYAALFEPIAIGPVTAPNRFYQVPHCNGMGHRHPSAMAAMRGVKAEGGWGVVATEVCEIHPSGDVTPHVEARLWDDRDIPALALVADSVHKHGALAAIELGHHGMRAFNRYSREIPMGPTCAPMGLYDPTYSRAMSQGDIRDLRRWHRAAALRAKKAGFDLVYVYAAHGLTLPFQFLSRRFNDRTDEYGGSLENRARLLRELIEDTKDAVGDRCGVVVRFAVDEMAGPQGIVAGEEGRAVVEFLAELPDLWDVNVAGWENDSVTSRFASENFQEPFIEFVKQVTRKPVVGVGRITSPDTMISLLRRGIVDLIGAARPSIADPFLPRKIRENRLDLIRECIGCNICVTGDYFAAPIRCTQNPTMGEEWRKGWHPERIAPRTESTRILVVGSGPAGLEATRALAARGYDVGLAEASRELGGRVAKECRLPGLSEWVRVRDYRERAIKTSPNVEVYYDNPVTADDILQQEFPHVVIATGSQWLKSGVGRTHRQPIPGSGSEHVLTPDDIVGGHRSAKGAVLIFDDDHYYMGGLLAEKLAKEGHAVLLVTPAVQVSQWTVNTMEQGRIQVRLMQLGVDLICAHDLLGIQVGHAEIACVYTGKTRLLPAQTIVMVTSRQPANRLFLDLQARADVFRDAGIKSVTAIGDCLAPGTIASAVYSGHRFAREFGEDLPADQVPFRRELIALES
jgi:dimethylamine/trimethylamine dehydrogenase